MPDLVADLAWLDRLAADGWSVTLAHRPFWYSGPEPWVAQSGRPRPGQPHTIGELYRGVGDSAAHAVADLMHAIATKRRGGPGWGHAPTQPAKADDHLQETSAQLSLMEA